MMKEEFIAEIDAALEKMGYSDRAALIREAVYEKMERSGVKVPKEYHIAPARTGKGGPAKYAIKRQKQSQSQKKKK